MIRVVICGIHGRMGAALVQLARDSSEVAIIGGIGRAAEAGAHGADIPVVPMAAARDLLRDADVLIDFSAPEATRELLGGAAEFIAGHAAIIGTTGLDPSTQRTLDELALRAAVLTASNFSRGVNLLLGLSAQIAGVLDAECYDIEIVEAHHRGKADAPSGTALALGEAVARGRGAELEQVRRDGRSGSTGARARGEIGFHAVRGGGMVGEHRVIFAGQREVIEFRHEALDRAVFAEGALAAARWIAGRDPGRYTMQHVMGF